MYRHIGGNKRITNNNCTKKQEAKETRQILVVSTHLKNISQIGNLPQVGVKIKKCLKPPPRIRCDSYRMEVY